MAHGGQFSAKLPGRGGARPIVQGNRHPRNRFGGRVQSLFEKIDILLIPSQAEASATIARMTTVGTDPVQLAGLLRFTAPFDMAGNPTITLPGGFTSDGAPVGFQFAGKKWAEAMLFRAGHTYQQVTDWHRRHPDLGAI